jgi:alkylhydroperoxidase family enzyme
MSWLPESAPGGTPLDRVFELTPVAYERFRVLYATLWDGVAIDPATLELCRLRIATLLGVKGERCVRWSIARDTGCTEAQVNALPSWPESPLFTSAQRLCLQFAEQYVLDPHSFRDEDFADLREHLDAPAVAKLMLAVAVFDALARFRLALDIRPATDRPETVSGPHAGATSLP